MRRNNSITISADGSNRGTRHPTYEEAQQQEYALEVQSLEGLPGAPPEPLPPPELEKAHATVVIEEPQRRLQWRDVGAYFKSLPHKMHGGLDKRLPIPPFLELFWSWAGAFLGILSVAVLNEWVSPEIDLPLMVGSFGASAVLVFAIPESKLSQPRNVSADDPTSNKQGLQLWWSIGHVWHNH